MSLDEIAPLRNNPIVKLPVAATSGHRADAPNISNRKAIRLNIEKGGKAMAFWFQQNFVLAAGKTMNVDYWFNSGAFNGANMATAIPHYAANAGLLATGQGLRYDFTSRRYFYNVIMSNTGSTTANFQLAGGGFS